MQKPLTESEKGSAFQNRDVAPWIGILHDDSRPTGSCRATVATSVIRAYPRHIILRSDPREGNTAAKPFGSRRAQPSPAGIGAGRDDIDDALQHLGDILDVIDNQYLVEVWSEHFEELNQLCPVLCILIAENLVQNQEAGVETRALATDERDGDA